MSEKKKSLARTLLKLTVFIVPGSIILASVLFPLQTLVRQGFVGVMLVWFGVQAMIGFPGWE